MELSTIVPAAFALSVIAASLFFDYILERRLVKCDVEGDKDDRLRPAEFGYLVRNGDRNHAILVMAVDLLQRATKEEQGAAALDTGKEEAALIESMVSMDEEPAVSSEPVSSEQVSSEPTAKLAAADENDEAGQGRKARSIRFALKIPELATYERQMWKNVTESLKLWTQKKIDQVSPGDVRKNPVRFVQRVTKIYDFLTGTLTIVVKDVIQDPRQLKRYFTVGGVVRLLADFTTAGYQSAFEIELKKDLLMRGMIISEQRRREISRIYLVFAGAGLLASFAAIYLLVKSALLSISIFLFASVLAFLLRAIHEGKSFLPYYSEVLHLLNTLSRSGWRIRLARLLLRFVNGLFIFVLVEVAVILLTGAYLVFLFAEKDMAVQLILLTIAFSLAHLSLINLGFKAWRLAVEERATEKGRRLMDAVKQRVANVSPVDSAAKLLQKREYDPTFSELVAIYGPEALIILS